MGDKIKYAYLREFLDNTQCELNFYLKVEIENETTRGFLFEEEIKAVRQSTDTVGSLLQHLANKINKSVKTKNEQGGNANTDETQNLQIYISLKKTSTNKKVDDNMVLINLIKAKLSDLELTVFNEKYKVEINSPLVKDIQLPQALFANFSVQPSKLHMIFTEHFANEFSWYISKDKENWVHKADTYRYDITEQDIGYYLKLRCVPGNLIGKGPPAEAISENTIEHIGNIPSCPFELRHKYTMQKAVKDKFRVVTYNVLSSRYTELDDKFLSYCSPKYLSIHYRKQLIAKELLGYNADIISLQEVDSSAFTSYYKDIFRENGYMSFFHKKGDRISEGLACIFNKTRFKKIFDDQMVYSQSIQKNDLFGSLWKLIKSNEDVREYFKKQMTSMQVTVLRERSSDFKKHIVIVANTHLFYHPDAEHIRLLQAHMATTYLNTLRKHYLKQGEQKVTVIFSGDFNTIPDSAVYSYMIDGKISTTHEISKMISNRTNFSHNFIFQSACGTPPFTNYTVDFKNCLDYIFVEEDKVKVHQIVPLPSDEELKLYEGLPNEVYPSDHLALVVDLEYSK